MSSTSRAFNSDGSAVHILCDRIGFPDSGSLCGKYSNLDIQLISRSLS